MSTFQIVNEKKFIQERLGIAYENLSQSYLRAETALSNLSSYAFQLQANRVATPIVTENLLNLNDQFVITHFTIGLKYIASDTPSALQHLNAQVYTYADTNVFAGNAANAAGIFNSDLNFTIDRREFLPAFPMNAFYRVPTAQSTNLTTAGTVATPAATFTGNTGGVNGYENGLFGFYVSEPTLIDGRQTLDINLNLGASVSIATVGTDPMVYATLELRGYLVVNAKS
ncbi:MAG: hypothetical protein FGM41_10885 [Bacteroidetes bacterium]|nr:hypothetical protein [Bacteroidota bacterium]